jgi:VanZ family protein
MLLAYCGLIFWLSSQSDLPHPNFAENQNKVEHLAAYAVMGWLSWRFFAHFIAGARGVALACILFCSLYGLSDEWHQSLVPGRFADSGDWLADALGALLGAAVSWRVSAVRGTGLRRQTAQGDD